MKKIRLENIVFLQGDDYTQMCDDIDPDYDPMGIMAAWIDESKLIDYLLQWWYPSEHMENVYNAEDINTEFLGYERMIDGNTFLLSLNESIGYAGLSRIIEIFEEQ